jgi:DNA-binding transcriptional LysR family regulator
MGAETPGRIGPESLGLDTLSRPGPGPGCRAAGVEIRHLRYFVRVAEELHFGRAAAQLYITQPGLSQAIARLERELDVQLFTRTRSNVELTQAGTELLPRARRLLADLEETVTRVRVVGRGDAGVVRVGVALLVEPIVAPALKAFHYEHEGIVLDRSAMVSERLIEELREGRLDAALIHQVPVLAAAEGVAWEPLRRGRLAVLASPFGKLARRGAVQLSELRDETFLVDPRSLAPGSFEGLKLMCREHGGFDARLVERAAASASAFDTDWRLIQDGTAIAVMAEESARAVPAVGVAVVSVEPPPQYVLALAWRRDEHDAAAERFLGHLRSYRDQHGWLTRPEPAAAAL